MRPRRNSDVLWLIEDNTAFAKELIAALGQQGLTGRHIDYRELDQLTADEARQCFVALVDLTLQQPGVSAPGDAVGRGLKAISSLTGRFESLRVIAYTANRFRVTQESDAIEAGAYDAVALGAPTPAAIAKRLQALIERIGQEREEQGRLEEMLRGRRWASALLDVWGVGVAVVGRHDRIAYTDERHHQLTPPAGTRGRRTCYQTWHGYQRACLQCDARTVMPPQDAPAESESLKVDLVGERVLHAWVRAVPLRVAPEDQPFAAMEAVVPLHQHDPLVHGAPLRLQAGALAQAVLCHAGARRVAILAVVRHNGVDHCELLAEASTEPPVTARPEPSPLQQIAFDHWIEAARQSGLPQRVKLDVSADRAAETWQWQPYPAAVYLPLRLTPEQTPFGFVRVDLDAEPAADRPVVAPRLAQELAHLLASRLTRPYERWKERDECRKALEWVRDAVGVERLRLYRAHEDGTWLWGYLHAGSVVSDFEATHILVRQDPSSYRTCVLDRRASIFDGTCPLSRQVGASISRIEVPVYDDQCNLVAKLSADNGQRPVSEEHLRSLSLAAAEIRELLCRTFLMPPSRQYCGQLSHALDWSRLQARVALANSSDQALASLTHELMTQTGATSAYLRLLREDGFLWLVRDTAFGDLSKVVPEKHPWGQRNSLAAIVSQDRVPRTFEGEDDWGELLATWGGRADRSQLEKQVAVGAFPLIVGKEVLGTLHLHSEVDAGFFRPEIVRAAVEVASDIARIVRDVRDAANAARAAQLQQWRDLAFQLAHQIKNPLFALVPAVAEIRTLVAAAPGGDLAAALTDTEAAVARIERVVQGVMDYAKVQAVPEELLPLPTAQAVWVQAARGWPAGHGMSAEFAGPENLLATADRKLLQTALEALFTNCQQHGGKQVKVRVDGPCVAGEDPFPALERYAMLSIEDSGTGIPPALRPKLFQPFGSARPESTGLGLAAVRRFIEAMGGQVTEDGPGELSGARFRIGLPMGDPSG
ncbi:MAG: GAF domain-containing sensor histidine kinase [Fimbriimonadaceae bacterium]|nr:GAF domain-containing sensor histidine kinase [Fimbriimonadaceae bacterium]